MPTLIAGIVAVALLYVALNVIKGADPKWLAKIVRTGGGIVTLAAALERKFPFNKRYMELFDIQLTNPQLTLDPVRNRVNVQFDAAIDNKLFFRQALTGRFALDSGLRYDAPTRSVVLQDPEVRRFDVQGMPAQFSRQLNG